MNEFFKVFGSIMLIVAVLSGSMLLGVYAGKEEGRQELRRDAAKRNLAQFYLDHKTGKVDFQFLDLQAYTNTLIRELVPQRVPGPERQ